MSHAGVIYLCPHFVMLAISLGGQNCRVCTGLRRTPGCAGRSPSRRQIFPPPPLRWRARRSRARFQSLSREGCETAVSHPQAGSPNTFPSELRLFGGRMSTQASL
eukprot:1181649-Prorocentrum_minimum.AAC.2